ncbi:MAG: type II toxin-antitoxin system VapC family toxin [Deltaproteobacteria bacterium]|nr:type II toxin-antitoxin system VapC family toxin [Deltaproteobacteria bacterium]
MYLLDTNICIALLKGADAALREKITKRDAGEFRLCSIVKAELLFGARKSHAVQANLRHLEIFFSQFHSLDFDNAAAERYGHIRAYLAAKGTPIGPNDTLIAAIAEAHDLVLVTRNSDEFTRVPGLRLESW